MPLKTFNAPSQQAVVEQASAFFKDKDVRISAVDAWSEDTQRFVRFQYEDGGTGYPIAITIKQGEVTWFDEPLDGPRVGVPQ